MIEISLLTPDFSVILIFKGIQVGVIRKGFDNCYNKTSAILPAY